MLILFRHAGRKLAYDTASGALSTLTALEFRMLELLTPPMEPYCPTALRYELAKYDAGSVEAAYAALLEKAANGSIFAQGTGDVLRTPEGDADTVRAALTAAAEQLRGPVTPVGDHAAVAREIFFTHGKLKD